MFKIWHHKQSGIILPLISLFSLALLLRLLHLGNTFQSSDNAQLAVRIIKNSGYVWMTREAYSVLIYLFAKLLVGLVSFFGVSITEFWWKAPVALLGAFQVPLTFFFENRLGR